MLLYLGYVCCNKRGDPSVAQLGSARVVVAGAQNEVGKALKLFFSAFDSTVASAVILSSPL